MAIDFSHLLLLITLLFLPFIHILKLKFSSCSERNYRLPPGPWKLPILGTLHHLIGRGLPHEALRRLSRHYGDIMFVRFGELQAMVVSSKETAREVMTTHGRIFCDRPVNPAVELLTYGLKDFAFAPDGEYWREMRKICMLELLSSKRVQSFRSISKEEVQNFIQEIRSLSSSTSQSLDLSSKLTVLINDITLRAIFGRKTVVRDWYFTELRNLIDLVSGFGVANLFPSSRLVRMLSGASRRAQKTRYNLDQMFEDILREQRSKNYATNEGSKNILSVLLTLHDEDSENSVLSIDSIKAVINVII